jgi:hypothetical protein
VVSLSVVFFSRFKIAVFLGVLREFVDDFRVPLRQRVSGASTIPPVR